MENRKTQIKKIENHQEMLTKVFKKLESVAVIEEKLKMKKMYMK